MEQRGECWQLRSVYAAAVLIHFLMAACSMAKVPVQSMNKLLECFELNLNWICIQIVYYMMRAH